MISSRSLLKVVCDSIDEIGKEYALQCVDIQLEDV